MIVFNQQLFCLKYSSIASSPEGVKIFLTNEINVLKVLYKKEFVRLLYKV